MALAHHQDFDRATAALSDADALRSAAHDCVQALPGGDAFLLARTDAALMVCAAAAVLRAAPTTVERAYFGRTGWSPRPGAVLIEPVAPAPGLLASISDACPDLRVVVLDTHADERLPAVRDVAA